LSEKAEVCYKRTDFLQDSEKHIIWNDPDLGIKWPLPPGISPLLSEKDAMGKNFRPAEVFNYP